jgi:hypothetical protein
MSRATTYYYDDADSFLLTIHWRKARSIDEQWQALYTFWGALAARSTELRIRAGTMIVGFRDPGNTDGEELSIDADTSAADLRARLSRIHAASQAVLEPVEVKVGMQAPAWLPGDGLAVVDFHCPDLSELGSAELEPLSSAPDEHGLRPWRVVDMPGTGRNEGPIFIWMYFERSEHVHEVTASIRSRFDLWLPTRFDGEPNLPHGPRNLEWLCRIFGEIAAETDGELERLV